MSLNMVVLKTIEKYRMRTNGKNNDSKTPVEEQTAIELIRQYEELFGQTSEGQVIQKIDYLPPAFEFKKATMWRTVPHYYSSNTEQEKSHA